MKDNIIYLKLDYNRRHLDRKPGEVGLDAQQPHVIAFNTGKGEGIPPAPAKALGLRYFTIVLPNANELQRALAHIQAAGLPIEQRPEGIWVHDPSQIGLVLTEQMLAVTDV